MRHQAACVVCGGWSSWRLVAGGSFIHAWAGIWRGRGRRWNRSGWARQAASRVAARRASMATQGSVVHRRWGVHRDPGMPVLIIVVPEEVAAEYVDVFDGPEFAGERRAVLEGLEVRLRIRVIIGYVRAGMGLVDAEPRVQPGDGIRCHGGSERRGPPAARFLR